MLMKDMEFRYKGKRNSKEYVGKVIEAEVVMRMGFWVDTGNDRAYLCELEKRREGWELYIYYTGVSCHLMYLENLSGNNQKITKLLNNQYNDGMAIALAIKEVYIKSRGVIY